MKNDTILIVEDEPIYADWLFDFIESIEYNYQHVKTVDEAIDVLANTRFRVVIVDLSVPCSETLRGTASSKSATYSEYPGLFAADFARNHGHRGRQVIVYSVHEQASIKEVTNRLGCTYLAKGRPRSFKDELRNVLSYDPRAPKDGTE